MSNETTANTIPDTELVRVQPRIAKRMADTLKIQAICEGTTSEQIVTRLIAEYLDSPTARALRKEVA